MDSAVHCESQRVSPLLLGVTMYGRWNGKAVCPTKEVRASVCACALGTRRSKNRHACLRESCSVEHPHGAGSWK
jgi:hypothetical protein